MKIKDLEVKENELKRYSYAYDVDNKYSNFTKRINDTVEKMIDERELKVYRVKNIDVRDWMDSEYYFIKDDAYLKIWQGANKDLYFKVNTFGIVKKDVSFKVKKSEFPGIYKLIKEMLDKYETDDYKYVITETKKWVCEEYKELFEKGYFSYRSDAPADEYSDTFVYNYFSVKSNEDEYELSFSNSLEAYYFVVEVNTDRSRHGRLRFPVMELYTSLKDELPEITDYEVVRGELTRTYEMLKMKKNKVYCKEYRKQEKD